MLMPSQANSPEVRPGGRLASLDGFRGACGLTVFLTHWFLWANFRPKPEAEWLVHDSLKTACDIFGQLTWNCGGQHPAVLGFFVLSGFCIHASRARRGGESPAAPHEWRRYFLARSRRILPIYWWGALLGMGFVWLQTTWPTPNPLLIPHAAGDGRDLLLRVFALHALVPSDVTLGNWTLNTVSTEIVIYTLYPLLFLSTRRMGWAASLLGWIVLQIVALLIAPDFSPTWIANTPLIMGAYWYVGMLAAEWHYRSPKIFPGWVPLLAWALFLGLREVPDSAPRYVLIHLVRSLGFAAVLLWLISRETTRPSFASSAFGRFMCLVGRTSYSLYVVHTPVILATTWALDSSGIRSYSVQLLLTLATSIAATALTYWFIERPLLSSRPSIHSAKITAQPANLPVAG
jgi:peptidoglycan/LPS O-acetylase OafA/YrhL